MRQRPNIRLEGFTEPQFLRSGHDVGVHCLVTKSPQQIIAEGANWRLFEELKRELRD
jgi:hypothetical protein